MFALISDKLHNICFKTNENSLIILNSNDDHCELVIIQDFEIINSANNSIFVIFKTIALIFDFSNCICFKTNEDSLIDEFRDRARQFCKTQKM